MTTDQGVYINFEPFDTSMIYDNGRPTIGYAKQLVFSRTKLEFRLLWNKIFQKEDDELGWLLNPYRNSKGNRTDATMMTTFARNASSSYQYSYDDVGSASASFGRGERVTIHGRRGIAKLTDGRQRKKDEKTLGEKAIQLARYMGMGVYMTSAAFPSPLMPFNDTNVMSDKEFYYQGPQNVYAMSRLW